VLGAKSYSLYGSAEAGPLAFASTSTIDLDAGEVGLLRKGCGLLQSGGGDERKATRFSAPCVAPYLDEQILVAGIARPLDTWQSSDICRVYAEGVLSCEGRLAFVLNIGGEKFNIEEVERKIVALGDVKSVCVLPVLDALGVQRVVLFVCPEPGFERASFEERFRKALPLLLFPIRFFEVDIMPLGPTGKVKREQLRKLSGL
jgi:acyl-CoA synthetase (AMP-forming)/AMP-acid ligase II